MLQTVFSYQEVSGSLYLNADETATGASERHADPDREETDSYAGLIVTLVKQSTSFPSPRSLLMTWGFADRNKHGE